MHNHNSIRQFRRNGFLFASFYYNFRFVSFIIYSVTVTDSPYSMERQGSIRKFLREQFRDDKKKEHKDKEKESKESKENKENLANVNATSSTTASTSSIASTEAVKTSNTETKSKSSVHRLFRTVSSFLLISRF